jgi:hypothetical protein
MEQETLDPKQTPAPKRRRKHAQAVILIHGIGEQRPMQTLRGFVDNLLGGTGPAFYYSKPDRMAANFELRRLRAHPIGRPSTDFYEYYWAHHMRGTKISHVIPWLKALFIRKPGEVPPALQPTWYLTIGLLVLAAGVFAWLLTTGRLISLSGLAAVIPTALAATIQGFLVNSVGDAARYLDPHPDNVASRQVIRSEGVELLRKLHDSGDYDRIVVVGHSLGSVIAYDILSFYWSETGGRLNNPKSWPPGAKQDALKAIEVIGPALKSASSRSDVHRFREQQRELWLQQRRLGSPWLVTDFITMGSPLAHAAILLTRNAGELRARQRDRGRRYHPTTTATSQEPPFGVMRMGVPENPKRARSSRSR